MLKDGQEEPIVSSALRHQCFSVNQLEMRVISEKFFDFFVILLRQHRAGDVGKDSLGGQERCRFLEDLPLGQGDLREEGR